MHEREAELVKVKARMAEIAAEIKEIEEAANAVGLQIGSVVNKVPTTTKPRASRRSTE